MSDETKKSIPSSLQRESFPADLLPETSFPTLRKEAFFPPRREAPNVREEVAKGERKAGREETSAAWVQESLFRGEWERRLRMLVPLQL